MTTLVGLLLVLPGADTAWIAYDGCSWVIRIYGVWAVRQFPTRMNAALLIGRAFQNARAEAL